MNSNIQTQERQNTTPQRSAGDSERDASVVVPPVDVFENESGITLLADLPGVTRERLGVRVDGETLTIEASAAIEGPQAMELIYNEAPYPAYRRSFTLSRELDSSRI